MKFLVQAFWLLFFYLLGLGVSLLIGGIIPGSVLGMVLLFMALAFGWLPVQRIERIAELLLDNMILFFLPAAVGLITSVGLISANLVAILVAATVSTVLIVAVVAGTQQRLEIRKRKRKIREGGHETR
jgi:holin-like protein